MRPRVYLAGPIFGRTDDECRVWRDRIRARLPAYEHVDPMSRDYRGVEDENDRAIVEGDKADIDACDVVVADARVPSSGTSMEILYAWESGVPVVAIVGERVSPWIRFHSTALVRDEEGAALAVLRVCP